MKYLYFSFYANNANALVSPYNVGLPSTMSICALSHVIEKKLNIEVLGTAVSYTGFQYTNAHKKYSYGMMGQLSTFKKQPNPSTVDEKWFNSKVHVIIKFKENETTPFSLDSLFEEKIEEKLNSDLINMRFCGAPIHIDSDKQNVFIYDNMEELFSDNLFDLKDSFFIEDRGDLLEDVHNSENPMHEYMQKIKIRRKKDSSIESNNENGYIVPILIGYKAIENPKARANSRKGYMHCFSEPVLSLGRLRSFFSTRIAVNDNEAKIFWKYDTDGINFLTNANNH